jgi:hypothetical protein
VGRQVQLHSAVLAAAGTFVGDPIAIRESQCVSLLSKFVRAAGGTSCKVFLQTSLDDGATWIDIAQNAFLTTTANKIAAVKTAIARAVATPGDGTLADDTIVDGFIGDRLRAKYIVAGTYSGASSIAAFVVVN